MTIRGRDIINTTLQMKCTKIEVMELKCGGAGILTQALLTLRPELSTAMLSSSHDNHLLSSRWRKWRAGSGLGVW